MVQITVDKTDMIEQLKNDPKKREEFLTNTHKLVTDMGVQISHSELKDKVEAQLRVDPNKNIKVASLAILINLVASA
jgi:hypothetical protein